MHKFLSSDERSSLLQLHRSEKDRKTGDRIKVVLWADDGWSFRKIARALFIDDETVRRHLHEYQQSQKLSNASGGYESKLTRQQSKALTVHLEQHTYLSVYEIIEYVEATYGVNYSHSGMINWLHQYRFSYKSPARVPAKCDPTQQEVFIREYQQVKDTLPDDAVILFGDGVHPTMNTKLSSGWIRTGKNKPIKTVASQTRVNLLGAINLADLSLTRRTYKTINSDAVSAFMQVLKEAYPDKKIHFILDRGPYNRSKETLKAAKKLNIDIHWLPPYSPNLNPIERCWKVMNEEVKNNVFFSSASEFKSAIHDFFESTWEKIKSGLFTRFNDYFQRIKPAF